MLKKEEYTKPSISVKKIDINFFTNPEFINDQSLLACCCSYCIGDTCPSDCSTTCFLTGTKILTDKGLKNIEEINKDRDVVISYDLLKRKQTKSSVREVIIHKDVSLFIIINKQIKVTPEHRFWVNENDWTRTKDIQIGDFLLAPDAGKVFVNSKEIFSKSVTVYNLELNGEYHNFFADGVLVHNWK